MNENTRYSIAGEILDDIVHAIQEQKKTTKKYTPEQIAGVIRKFVVTASGEAESTFTTPIMPFGNVLCSAQGVIPIYQTATVESEFVPHTSGFTSNAVGELSE